MDPTQKPYPILIASGVIALFIAFCVLFPPFNPPTDIGVLQIPSIPGSTPDGLTMTSSPPLPGADSFGPSVRGDSVSITKEDRRKYGGFATRNKEFFEKIMKPRLLPLLPQLSKEGPVSVINTLTLQSHRMFQEYFGKGYYRWGGDILDLDDPQKEGIRYDRAFGLDCSGFVSMPYEIAVTLGLLRPDDPGSVFSSTGFERYCRSSGVKDQGGRGGLGNRFRLDSGDLVRVGREIFSLEKLSSPTDQQIRRLQAGDIVGTEGHVGIIVKIDNAPYYLESGGYVLPTTGYKPCPAGDALTIFAKQARLTIRRALPGD